MRINRLNHTCMKLKISLPVVSILTFLNVIESLGQVSNYTYILEGTVNADTGTVVLLPIGGKDFDSNSDDIYQAKVRQGQFSFKGQMTYPGGFLLALFPKYVSSPFIIEPGTQTIKCNVDSLREIPKVSNRSTEEVGLLLHTKAAVLLGYVKQHPDSYAAFWNLVERMGNGYAPTLDSIYASFSPSLKTNYTGKVIAQRLKSSRATAIGQVFPRLNLVDMSNKTVVLQPVKQAKYTLVDFWFSHCGPCLSEFPKLKNLFSLYNSKGFDIISISVDKQTDIESWKRILNEKQLSWTQYLDLAGRLTTGELSINLFPSNFLLDEQGRIIRKNIRPDQLSMFLAEKM